MKKVKFNNSKSIELHASRLGEKLTGNQSEVMTIEGSLVGDHVCIQNPMPKNNASWRVSLYPWGELISGDFYTKSDATEYAKDVSKLSVDWNAIYSAKDFPESKEYKLALKKLLELSDRYSADGYFEPRDDPS